MYRSLPKCNILMLRDLFWLTTSGNKIYLNKIPENTINAALKSNLFEANQISGCWGIYSSI